LNGVDVSKQPPGLDVDKEDFEKHRVKEDAAKLFERIWSVAGYVPQPEAGLKTEEFPIRIY
jgi:hypothetical protein